MTNIIKTLKKIKIIKFYDLNSMWYCYKVYKLNTLTNIYPNAFKLSCSLDNLKFVMT